MSKNYSLTCKYLVEVPEDTKYEELHMDLADALIETIEAHKGSLSGTVTLIRSNQEGHINQELK